MTFLLFSSVSAINDDDVSPPSHKPSPFTSVTAIQSSVAEDRDIIDSSLFVHPTVYPTQEVIVINNNSSNSNNTFTRSNSSSSSNNNIIIHQQHQQQQQPLTPVHRKSVALFPGSDSPVDFNNSRKSSDCNSFKVARSSALSSPTTAVRKESSNGNTSAITGSGIKSHHRRKDTLTSNQSSLLQKNIVLGYEQSLVATSPETEASAQTGVNCREFATATTLSSRESATAIASKEFAGAPNKESISTLASRESTSPQSSRESTSTPASTEPDNTVSSRGQETPNTVSPSTLLQTPLQELEQRMTTTL